MFCVLQKILHSSTLSTSLPGCQRTIFLNRATRWASHPKADLANLEKFKIDGRDTTEQNNNNYYNYYHNNNNYYYYYYYRFVDLCMEQMVPTCAGKNVVCEMGLVCSEAAHHEKHSPSFSCSSWKELVQAVHTQPAVFPKHRAFHRCHHCDSGSLPRHMF